MKKKGQGDGHRTQKGKNHGTQVLFVKQPTMVHVLAFGQVHWYPTILVDLSFM